ncbi:hypothetical protein [Microbacterium sp.]|uniref:hypothetical protein n=1 Tax=Microbacterium sp. TaxID=51671 RepID=UPI003F9AA38C
MTTAISYRGDDIFSQLPPQGDEATHPVACLIWGADLRGLGPGRYIRHALHDQASAAFSAIRTQAVLRHLIIAYRCAPQLGNRLRHTAYNESRRLHAAFELERARDVDVIMIDVTELDDNNLAHHRFTELAGKRAGVAGYAAISWSDIQHQPIQTAVKQDVV